MTKVLLGFKVPSGESYYVPIHHTSFTGMSDLSGKSTGQEAKFRREVEVNSKRKILVFLTKRGEKIFLGANKIKPYYKAQGDWEHIRGLLEASWHEKLKFETPWIYDVCKYPTPAKSEEEVFERLHTAIESNQEPKTGKPIRDFDKKIYTHLYAYLEKIIPVIRASKDQFSDKLELKSGLNVMDLTPWYANEEVQTLSIAGCMRHVLANEDDTDIGMPEAWKMLPEGRNTPVKLLFEKYIREGATNRNFLTIDAQDLGGVDKTHLRQVSIWIMGKMMQINEVKRLLEQIPKLNVKPDDFQTLKLGHFYAVNGIENRVDLIYIWPWGVPKELAVNVAMQKVSPEIVKEWLLEKRKADMARAEAPEFGDWMEAVRISLATIEKEMEDCKNQIEILQHNEQVSRTRFESLENILEKFSGLEGAVSSKLQEITNFQAKIEDFLTRAEKLPISTVEGAATLQQIKWNIKVQPPKVEFKVEPAGTTLESKLMWMAKEKFFDVWRQHREILDELGRRAWLPAQDERTLRVTVGSALENLVNEGFLAKRKTDRAEYKLPDLVSITE